MQDSLFATNRDPAVSVIETPVGRGERVRVGIGRGMRSRWRREERERVKELCLVDCFVEISGVGIPYHRISSGDVYLISHFAIKSLRTQQDTCKAI